jgi:hypothetical protein
VPEPAAWALMLVGFGAVGAALRRRRLAASPRNCPAGRGLKGLTQEPPHESQ